MMLLLLRIVTIMEYVAQLSPLSDKRDISQLSAAAGQMTVLILILVTVIGFISIHRIYYLKLIYLYNTFYSFRCEK